MRGVVRVRHAALRASTGSKQLRCWPLELDGRVGGARTRGTRLVTGFTSPVWALGVAHELPDLSPVSSKSGIETSVLVVTHGCTMLCRKFSETVPINLPTRRSKLKLKPACHSGRYRRCRHRRFELGEGALVGFADRLRQHAPQQGQHGATTRSVSTYTPLSSRSDEGSGFFWRSPRADDDALGHNAVSGIGIPADFSRRQIRRQRTQFNLGISRAPIHKRERKISKFTPS